MARELVVRLLKGEERIVGVKILITDDCCVKLHQYAFLSLVNRIAGKCGLKMEIEEVEL